MAILFVNKDRRVLWYRTPSLPPVGSFSFPDISNESYKMVITRATIAPQPITQIHSSIGGMSYLSVFGEDPVQIQLTGVIAGGINCFAPFNPSTSALAKAVQIFRTKSVVGNPLPLRFSIAGSRARAAYMIALRVDIETGFSDVVNINMAFVSEPFVEVQKLKPVIPGAKIVPVVIGGSPTDIGGEATTPIGEPGLIIRPVTPEQLGEAGRTVFGTLDASSLPLLPNGDVEQPQAVGLVATNYDKAGAGRNGVA